jgi:spore coat polysaccharide biosynthesis protein SpsF
MMVRAFIQARMSSRRFPGKVLAPFRGRPVITHLIERVARVLRDECITVLTSAEPADDPLASYVRDLGVDVYRGALHNVVERFQGCLRTHPCTWFFRLCADSPLLDYTVLRAMLAYDNRTEVDLITNVYPRTFPKGQSVEMLNATTFAALDPERLTPEEREHVTAVFYHQPERFRLVNLKSTTPVLAETSLAVDTVEDLYRLEATVRSGEFPPHEICHEERP